MARRLFSNNDAEAMLPNLSDTALEFAKLWRLLLLVRCRRWLYAVLDRKPYRPSQHSFFLRYPGARRRPNADGPAPMWTVPWPSASPTTSPLARPGTSWPLGPSPSACSEKRAAALGVRSARAALVVLAALYLPMAMHVIACAWWGVGSWQMHDIERGDRHMPSWLQTANELRASTTAQQ